MFKAISPQSFENMLHYFFVSSFADEEHDVNPVLVPMHRGLNRAPPPKDVSKSELQQWFRV